MTQIIQLGDLLQAYKSKRLDDHCLNVGAALHIVRKYLESGVEIMAFFDVNEDCINPSRKGPGGFAEWRSDGEWLWPNILSYYIQEYDLPIPKAFYEYMRDHSWATPQFLSREQRDMLKSVLFGDQE